MIALLRKIICINRSEVNYLKLYLVILIRLFCRRSDFLSSSVVDHIKFKQRKCAELSAFIILKIWSNFVRQFLPISSYVDDLGEFV